MSKVYLDKVDSFINKENWKVNENSNAGYNYGTLQKYQASLISKDYWLDRVYMKEITYAHEKGYFHIHDLGGLTIYCCGYSLLDLINKGITGIDNIPESDPAKHFDSILAQLANIFTIFQNEIMGAVAFSSFDTLVAPFVKKDGLNYKKTKQCMQQFIYQVNSNSRSGAEPVFSNLTFDLTPPKDLLDKKAIVANEELDFTYKQCQKEMDMVNRAFFEIMLKGDAKSKSFAYPIPTFNIHKRFDWDNPNNEGLWEMTGKYGIPYFSNYINSDMDPEDARSMCCRLRLDKRELLKRNGGLFGSGEKTGSIGVVTLGLPRMGYLASNTNFGPLPYDASKVRLFKMIEHYMDLAKESLELKRVFLQKRLDGGLIPAFKEYVGTLDNHFSTIGYVGLNEMTVNFMGQGIKYPEAKKLGEEVLDFMLEKIKDYQEETGNLYNLEASPAESTCYRLAKIDKQEFGNKIFTQGTDEAPYYTNSCHLPVAEVESIGQLLDHQNSLQIKHTGGTVVHLYMECGISAEMAKHIVRTAFENYEIPYLSESPVHSICKDHGYIMGIIRECHTCGKPTKTFQRITGYTREISNFNIGKISEFWDRSQIKIN